MITLEEWEKPLLTTSSIVDLVNALLIKHQGERLDYYAEGAVTFPFPIEKFPRSTVDLKELDQALANAGWSYASFLLINGQFHIAVTAHSGLLPSFLSRGETDSIITKLISRK